MARSEVGCGDRGGMRCLGGRPKALALDPSGLVVLTLVVGLVAALLVVAHDVAAPGRSVAVAQSSGDVVSGSDDPYKGPKLCGSGGSVGLKADDWSKGAFVSSGPEGERAYFAYVYFPAGVTSVTTQFSITGTTDHAGGDQAQILTSLSANLKKADIAPQDGTHVALLPTATPEGQIPVDTTGTWSFGPTTGDVNLGSNPGGWYKLQINASMNFNWLHNPNASWEFSLSYNNYSPPSCSRDKLEMACPCNPASGLITSGTGWKADPVSTGFGSFSESATDLDVPSRGGHLNVSRTYSSLAASTESPLGFGWSWAFGARLAFNTPTSGDITVMQPGGAPAVFSAMVVSAAASTRYQAPPWVSATLVVNSDSTFTFRLKDGTEYVFENDAAPGNGRLKSIQNRNGYSTTLNYNTDGTLATVVDDSSNRSLTFEWNLAKTRIASVTDQATPTARTVTYSYNANGNLEDVTDAGGNKSHYGYDGSNRLETLRSAKQANQNPQVTTKDVVNVYDTYGRVTTQTDNRLSPARVTTFNYAPSGLPAQDPNNPNGATKVTVKESGGADVYTRVDFYTNGQRTKVVDGVGADATTRLFTYDPGTGGISKVEVQTAAGPPATTAIESEMAYDWEGNLVSAKDGLGRTAKFTFNDFGEPLTETDPAGVVTTYTYDSWGNPTEVCTPIADTLPTSGTKACVPGVEAQRTTMEYYPDRNGDLRSVRDPDHQGSGLPDASNSTRFTYDEQTGDLLTVSSIQTPEAATGGNKVEYHYDNVGRLEWMVAPKGAETPTNPDDYKTTFVTNAYGAVTRTTDPRGEVTERHFDEDGNVDWVQPADGNCTSTPKVKCTDFVYNDADQLVTTVRPEAGTSQTTEYTIDGQVKRQIDALNNATVYGYDTAGRLQTVTDPNNRATEYRYDAFGRLQSRQEPSGNCAATPKTGCVTYGYDAASRLSAVTYSDGVTPNITGVAYDAAGRRTSVTTTAGTSTFAWDTAGRLRSSTESGETIAYRWDAASNLTKIAYPGGNCDAATPVKCVVRGFDPANRLTSVTDWNNQTTTFHPDQHGNYDQITYPAGTTNVDDFSFDEADRLMGITYKKGATTTASLTYDRYPNGALKSEARTGLPNPNNIGADYYGYDNNNRLCWKSDSAGTNPTCAAPPAGANTVTWQYDGADNLTKKDDGTGFKADPANQLCYSVFGAATANCATPPSGATDFDYDSRGNRTTKTPPAGGAVPTTYGYDQENRLTSASVPAQLGNAGEYTPLNPARVYDSRSTTPVNCTPNCTQFAAGETREIQITSQGGIPASNVSAVAINLLVVAGSSGPGYLTAYSSDITQPATANLNYSQGQTLSNGAVVKVGANGKIKITNSTGVANVIVDVSGYYTTWLGGAGGTFHPLDPQRAYDSRAASPVNCTPNCTQIPANSTRDIQITGIAGIPTSDVASVTINLAVTGSTQWGKLVAYASDAAEPSTTSLNFTAGQTIGELNIVKVGADGKIRIKNGSTGPADVIVDIQGWSTATEDPAGSDYIAPATPTRIYNSRSTDPVNCNPDCTPVPANTTRTIQITGLGGVPAGATAVALNIAVVDAAGAGYLTAYPSGTTLPGTANVIFANTTTVANGAIAKLGADGKLSLYVQGNNANVIVDVSGWYINARNTYTYTYNADGIRQKKTTPTGDITYIWTYAQGLPQLAATKNQTGQYTYYLQGPGEHPYAQINPDGTTTYLHHDQLGSTRLTTNTSGNPTGRWTYSPYGTTAATLNNPTATNLLYTGEQLDIETGLYYLRARFYDPGTGQFISRDPITPLTRSAYAYVSGDPVNQTDPAGLCNQGGASGVVYGLFSGDNTPCDPQGSPVGPLSILQGLGKLGYCDPFDPACVKKIPDDVEDAASHFELSVLSGCVLIWCRNGTYSGKNGLTYQDAWGVALMFQVIGGNYVTRPSSEWHGNVGCMSILIFQGCKSSDGNWSCGLGFGLGAGIYGYKAE